MAFLDSARERVVLRIVYDGPALAGKTTSLKSLAEMFGRPVFSSESADGRTLHFDWMEYQGGRFEQLAVCCQVVTVPGQEAFKARRFKLLESADAIVFVVDSRTSELSSGLASLESLRGYLATLPEPHPGVLLQANKRDLPGAAGVEALRKGLGLGETVGVTESVATDGNGVRQTFVFAVRLALDRVAELRSRGQLAAEALEIDSGPALLAALKELEGDSSPATERRQAPLPAGLVEEHSGEDSRPRLATSEIDPSLPGANLPTGCIWPPIEGRLVLHEATAEGVTLARSPAGDWRGSAGPWLIHSAAAGEYADGEQGRAALLAWARWHALLGRHLSPRRCVALGKGAAKGFRLWQVVRRETTLSQRVIRALRVPDVEEVARTLLQSAEALREIHDTVAPLGLRVNLETVGLLDSGPAYVAWAPTPRGLGERPSGFAARALELRAAFAPVLEKEFRHFESELPGIIVRVQKLSRNLGQDDLGRMLVELLEMKRWRGAPRP